MQHAGFEVLVVGIDDKLTGSAGTVHPRDYRNLPCAL